MYLVVQKENATDDLLSMGANKHVERLRASSGVLGIPIRDPDDAIELRLIENTLATLHDTNEHINNDLSELKAYFMKLDDIEQGADGIWTKFSEIKYESCSDKRKHNPTPIGIFGFCSFPKIVEECLKIGKRSAIKTRFC